VFVSGQSQDGGCHCGAIRYRAAIDLAEPVITCNCSICQSKGLLLTFVPPDGLELVRGPEDLSEYRFNTHKIAHRFCRTCGVEVFGEVQGQGVAINVRTLDAVDLASLKLQPFDGASR
jgi:hypothetical protein